jgi:hypothetical protein
VLIGRLIEAILFHNPYVRRAIQAGADIAIDAATAANPAEDWNWEELHRRFGTRLFDSWAGQRMCMIFGSSDLLPVVTDILERRNRVDKLAPRLLRARSVKLLDWDKCLREGIIGGGQNDARTSFPKPLHYLADWIAHVARSDRDSRRIEKIQSLKEMFAAGFLQRDTDEFRAQLRSHRRWAQGAKVEAVRGWRVPATESEFSVTNEMSTEAQDWPRQLTGDELITLFHVAHI